MKGGVLGCNGKYYIKSLENFCHSFPYVTIIKSGEWREGRMKSSGVEGSGSQR